MSVFGIRKKLKSLLVGPSNPIPVPPRLPRYEVFFEIGDGRKYTTSAKEGDSLVLASGRGPYPISTGCSDGTCATGEVEVLEGVAALSTADAHEITTKSENNVLPERRLGCQTAVVGEGVRVRIVNVLGEDLEEET